MKRAGEPWSAVGAAPAGAADENSAAAAVRRMFDQIAPRYDLLNDVLSCRVDRRWWRRTARRFAHILAWDTALILDLCSGTGSMALALRRAARRAKRSGQGAPIIAADFSHSMLARATPRFAGKCIFPVEADALLLPFPSSTFQLVVSAFGFRNLTNYQRGLEEIYRVLRPGGEVGILEFSEPRGPFGLLYRAYLHGLVPLAGRAISGVSGPYSYLPASVAKFPPPAEMMAKMREARFLEANWTPYTFGIAGLFYAKK